MVSRFDFLSLFENDLFVAFLIFGGVLILERIINVFLKKRLVYWAKNKGHKINETFLKEVGPSIFRLFFVLALRAFYSYLNLEIPHLSKIINTLVVIVATNFLIHIFELILKVWSKGLRANLFPSSFKKDVADSFSPLIKKISRVILVIIGLIVVLKIWSIDDLITPLIGGIGIAGLAISFAAQEALGDFIGGISLAADANFKVGDIISVDTMDLNGTVEDIGLRSTKIKSWDHEMIIVPNGKLSNSNIINFNLPDDKIRVKVPFSISYGSDVEKAKKIVLSIARSKEHFIKYPEPSVVFLEMNDFSLDFELRFWVKGVENRWISKWNSTDEIYHKFIENGISIPFPTRTVNLFDKTPKIDAEKSTKETVKEVSNIKKDSDDINKE
ncbi:MAG: mechanosensitive ion channel family protein [Candidatus Woesearchaeota archaeon]